jgi:voltage-gated potassium channel
MADAAHSRMSRVRSRLHEILEAGHAGDHVSYVFDLFIVILILLNVVAFTMGTVPDIDRRYGWSLELFNVVSVAIFTIEYLARLWVCVELPLLRHLPDWQARIRFASRPLLIVDFVAIAPFYLGALVGVDLRVLRVLRLLRFLKLARYSPALQTLGRVLATERNALFGAAIVMMSLLLFAATIIYFIERDIQPDKFGSVPQAAWWALATLTTVGFGDVVPVTVMGKLFGGLVMIFGLGMFALPIGILATGFSQEIHRREFVVTWSMISHVPLFANLNAASISRVMANLRAQTYPADARIIAPEDPVNAMYFIAAGEVAIEIEGERHVLEAGEFFGEAGLLREHESKLQSAQAVSNCDLMILDRHDFEHLMREHPASQIAAVQRSRRAKPMPDDEDPTE